MKDLIRLLDEFNMEYKPYYTLYLPKGEKEVETLDLKYKGDWISVRTEGNRLCVNQSYAYDKAGLGDVVYSSADELFIDLMNQRLTF